MKPWEEIIKKAMDDCLPWKAQIVYCAKAYIEANHAVRSNPCGLRSCHGPETDPIWAEYYALSASYEEASSKLWMATDVEYSENDPIANAAWNWRYWKVMARKCTTYLKSVSTMHLASKTMRNLHDAEAKLMEACGLMEFYKSPCEYLEEHFPNLKKDNEVQR